jgi:hypothetical protein
MPNRPKEDASGQRPPKPRLQKVTLYVRPDQILKLEEVQLQERRRTGRRPDKSALIQEALDLLFEHYGAPTSTEQEDPS